MIKNDLKAKIIPPESLILLSGILLISILLPWISNGFTSITGWFSFLVIISISSLLLVLGVAIVKEDTPPPWLSWMTVGAFLLRLGLGVLWFVALPEVGYDNEVNNDGYVMSDAWKRDLAAWDLSQSDENLLSSFNGYSSTDQYGGLLFISAFIYRFLGGTIHQPLLLVVFCAAFSSLVVPFIWSLSKNLFGEKTATIATWIAFLYPELVLLGSSQMREAFLPILVILAFLWLLKFNQTSQAGYLFGVLGTIVIFSAISGLIILLLVFSLVVFWFALNEWKIFQRTWFWITIGAVILVLAIFPFVFNLSQFSWFQVISWQKYLSESASGWLEKQFKIMPSWSHLPFLFTYGILRPMLPSALASDGVLIWKLIGIWRALGWTILLAFLIYATFLSIKNINTKKINFSLLFLVWVLALVASFWGGGDLWDNPRYRVSFAGLQIVLACWGIVYRKETEDPWLRRVIISVVILILWFIPWFLRRYVELPFEWSLIDLPDIIGAGFVSIALYLIWDKLAFDKKIR